MAVEWARNVLNLKGANSEEFDKNTPYPIIHLLPDQKDKPMGGSMRLGAQEIELKEGSLIHSIYATNRIFERHRHRYEFNNEFREEFEKSGLVVSAEHKGLVEALEFRDHPFFLGVQFHPEYSSKPLKPHPIFVKLLSL
jgi:CTP synthase